MCVLYTYVHMLYIVVYTDISVYIHACIHDRKYILLYIDPKRSVLSPRYIIIGTADRDLVTRRKYVNQTTAAKRDLLI